MKKMLCVMLSLVMVLCLMSGCDSLFAAGGETTGAEAGGNEPVKLTDKYTFEDPTDIEFDKRYVIYADENSVMVSSAKDYGMIAVYSITYAKEDAPVCGYEFMICDTAENAKKVIDLYAAQGTTLTAAKEDPTVLYAKSDGETLEASIMVYQSYGMIKEATVSAYVEFYATSIGGTIQ